VKVLLTGAAGFVGRHTVRELLARGHEVVAVVRDPARVEPFEWKSAVRIVARDIHQPLSDPLAVFGPADVVMHLAWHGLPNYRAAFHVEENLPRDFAFLKSLVAAGYGRLLVAGTCFECFPEGGLMDEGREGSPTLPYPLAKAQLRRQLVALQAQLPFALQWARLFYMYGEGQNPKSLMAQLDQAIDSGAGSFGMSGGEQLRDYLPVTEVAAKLVTLAEHADWEGVTHICSGQPITVRRLVEQHIAMRGAHLTLNLGVYPYADYEPMAFWGASARPWPSPRR
jgi:dTDP-6-deoxy-L-talose 4-dehydrogenase (NAD+)